MGGGPAGAGGTDGGCGGPDGGRCSGTDTRPPDD